LNCIISLFNPHPFAEGLAMFTPLVPIVIDSIYNNQGPLPKRMALCTPDMFAAIFATKADLKAVNNDLVLSDLVV
jgi:hypothetical protein